MVSAEGAAALLDGSEQQGARDTDLPQSVTAMLEGIWKGILDELTTPQPPSIFEAWVERRKADSKLVRAACGLLCLPLQRRPLS